MTILKSPNEELKAMLKAAVHFGHYTNKWNPKMKKHIYTTKDGVHVFDLHDTLSGLDAALDFLSKKVKEGKTVLLVSTKQQSTPIIKKVAEETGMPYVTNKWVPGFLTNFKTIKQRIKQLKDYQKMFESGEVEKYSKKEQTKIRKEMEKLEMVLGGVQNVTKEPDVIFVVDTVRDNTAVVEANKVGIPVVAIVDTNSDPDQVNFPIPGNDDAIKSITYFMDRVAQALKSK